jgi:glycosyltransferase involved in cell wall biosynthesis
MRILFLTNFYLVHESGGEDQSCQQVVAGLKQRGHTTLVLTSMHGTNNVPVEADGIYRSLYLEMDLVPWQHSLTFFTRRKAREKHNLQCFDQVMEEFRPDIIFIWGMWNLPKSLPALAEARYPDKVVYRFATYWPTLPSQHEFYWRARGRNWYSQILKAVLGRVALAMLARENRQPPLAFKHAICVSEATRHELVAAGIPVANARVIHTGLDAKEYLNNRHHPQPGSDNQSLNLLYAGRLVPEKGIDTVIVALEKLIRGDQDVRTLRLTIAGSDSGGYENYLRHLVNQAGLDDYVSFLGHVPSEEMPHLLQQFDVLLVPSIWAEPFSRMVLAGMILGLVVVATPRGGTTEILNDGENGLLFVPGDAEDLAQKILDLAADPGLRQRLALAGQQTVLENFIETSMMDKIESYLHEVAHPSSHEVVRQVEPNQDDFRMVAPPSVSVIIPTYNRKGPLRETLASLGSQTYPSDRFDVIVVDDGSTDGTEAVAAETFPFTLRLVRQINQGDAAARNFGARHSQADFLVFLDDDILVEPGYLTYLIHAHDMRQNRIVAGAWDLWPAEIANLSQTSKRLLASGSYYARSLFDHNSSNDADHMAIVTKVPFRDIHSNNMSLRREAYFSLGMMQALEFSGSSMWCDLDFNYRAYRQGFEFFRSSKAICWHRDRSPDNLDGFKRRMRTAAYRSVILFKKYPELLAHVPMFNDKTTINWRQDSARLIARKLARSLTASRPALWSMEQIVKILEKHYPASSMLPPLYRYIVGGYVFRGYREGLGEFGQIANVDDAIQVH